MDATLEQLWPLAIQNGWDRTKLTDIVTSLSYVCKKRKQKLKISKIYTYKVTFSNRNHYL